MPKITDPGLRPYWATNDGRTCRLYKGNVMGVLGRMKPKSVQCVVTSPPYWGLRDYGAGTQEIGSESRPDCLGWATGNKCGECHICNMVEVFHEVHRVLRDDGVCWVNYGDTYASGSTGRAGGGVFENGRTDGKPGDGGRERWARGHGHKISTQLDLPSGNLVGVPWRVALALQADGWILRSDIPWVKRSAMPESCRNRPAKGLEYVFLLVKKMGYYYDNDAVRRPQKEFISDIGNKPSAKQIGDFRAVGAGQKDGGFNAYREANGTQYNPLGRNLRNSDLWFQSVEPPHGLTGIDDQIVGLDVTSESYSGAHFATFGTRLITPLILAGTSEKGACAECNTPWRRVLSGASGGTIGQGGCTSHPDHDPAVEGNFKTGSSKGYKPGETTGWQPGCECNGKFVEEKVFVTRKIVSVPDESRDHSIPSNRNGMGASTLDPHRPTINVDVEETVEKYVPTIPLDQHPVVPCVVLDPFVGSGTTCYVALKHGRHAVGIDLSEKYLKEHAIPRVIGALGAKPSTAGLVAKEVERVELGGRVSRGTL